MMEVPDQNLECSAFNAESESFLSMFEVFDGPWLSLGAVRYMDWGDCFNSHLSLVFWNLAAIAVFLFLRCHDVKPVLSIRHPNSGNASV